MKTFIAVARKDEGSAYGVSFPDIPGCFSAADKLSDIVANAAEALDLWFEDNEQVDPRDIEVVRHEVAEDLREGAMLVAVPYFRRTYRVRRVNVSFDAGTLDAIDAAANQAKMSRSAFLAIAAEREIKGQHA